METKRIVFTEPNVAKLLVEEVPELRPNDVLVETAFSTISPGTERANLVGDANVGAMSAPCVSFPRKCGYASAGTVIKVGEAVTSLKVGDRVISTWASHSRYNVLPESNAVKIIDDSISFREASALLISTFPLAAVRKTGLEIGESCMVMGLGLLGQFAVRLARAAGAYPVIAVDPVESRREDALRGGTDYALNPFDEGFVERVKELTNGGVKAAIEVTGQGAGLDETLDCMARFGRVALLGCTRNKEFTIDYYRKVHAPGITLVGAHTIARPKFESSPGWFTEKDDLDTVQKLILGGRLDVKSMMGPVHSPEECETVFDALINDRNFPMLTSFDWSLLK